MAVNVCVVRASVKLKVAFSIFSLGAGITPPHCEAAMLTAALAHMMKVQPCNVQPLAVLASP